MNARSENAGSFLDTAKLVVALVVLVGSLFGFYYVEGQVPTWMRIVGLLAGVGIALWFGYLTHRGRAIWAFLREANVERQKVVWPTRQETVQTTIIVLISVVIIGIMLWLIDTFFAYLVKVLVG